MLKENKGKDHVVFGIILIIGFTILGPVMDTFAKLASSKIPIIEIAFFRFLIQSILLFPIGLILKVLYFPESKELALHFIRALFILTATSLFFGAIKYMPMADAIAIFLVNPFIMTIFGKLFLNEPLGWRRIVACFIGFFGAMLVIKPSFSMFGYVALFPLGTALTYACYMILTRHMTKKIHPIALQSFTGLAAVFIMFPVLCFFSFSNHELLYPIWPNFEFTLLLIGVGITASISHILVVFGLKYAPASTVAPILYLEIVAAAILGYFVFNDIPDLYSIIGVLIVVLSGLYVFMREHFINKKDYNDQSNHSRR